MSQKQRKKKDKIRCLTSLINREIKIKTTMRYHFCSKNTDDEYVVVKLVQPQEKRTRLERKFIILTSPRGEGGHCMSHRTT